MRAQLIEATALAYVLAIRDATGSSGNNRNEALLRADAHFHDLALALGLECELCDEHTCPGSICSYAVRAIELTPPL